jgi:hypothetical protein
LFQITLFQAVTSYFASQSVIGGCTRPVSS